MTFRALEEMYADKGEVLGSIEKIVASLSPAQLSFRPAPDAWSVGEIVEHLAIVEPNMFKVVGALTEKAEAAGDAAPARFEATLDDGIRTRSTGKVKTRPESTPTGSVPPEESLKTLRLIQSRLGDLRPRLAAVDASSVKFPHRALGEMTLGQWCAFIGAHEARHLVQIQAVLAAPGFPS
jgi:hypothetical protein